MSTTIEWTRKNEVIRACQVSHREMHEREMATMEIMIAWIRDALAQRDWYRLERLSRNAQEMDPMRAFDHIDLMNFQFQAEARARQ